MRHAVPHKGFGLIEIVIASTIVSLTILSLGYVFSLSTRINGETVERVRATALAEEGLEVVRYLRDYGWTSKIAPLSVSTTYYLAFATSTSQWSVTTTPQVIDGLFTRTIVLSPVARDGSDNIVTSGGTVDAGTLKATSQVTWKASSSVQVSTYITNMFNN